MFLKVWTTKKEVKLIFWPQIKHYIQISRVFWNMFYFSSLPLKISCNFAFAKHMNFILSFNFHILHYFISNLIQYCLKPLFHYTSLQTSWQGFFSTTSKNTLSMLNKFWIVLFYMLYQLPTKNDTCINHQLKWCKLFISK